MGHFVGQHGFHFFLGHALQQAGGNRHQRIALAGTGGKGVGRAIIDRHFRHGQLGTGGQGLDGLQQPHFGGILRLLDHARPRGPLGDGLGHEQRNEGAAKPHQAAEHQQHAEVEAVGSEVTVHAEQAGGEAQDQHHGQVGDEEQNDAFHGFS